MEFLIDILVYVVVFFIVVCSILLIPLAILVVFSAIFYKGNYVDDIDEMLN